jgi:hypothetical protein
MKIQIAPARSADAGGGPVTAIAGLASNDPAAAAWTGGAS